RRGGAEVRGDQLVPDETTVRIWPGCHRRSSVGVRISRNLSRLVRFAIFPRMPEVFMQIPQRGRMKKTFKLATVLAFLLLHAAAPGGAQMVRRPAAPVERRAVPPGQPLPRGLDYDRLSRHIAWGAVVGGTAGLLYGTTRQLDRRPHGVVVLGDVALGAGIGGALGALTYVLRAGVGRWGI